MSSTRFLRSYLLVFYLPLLFRNLFFPGSVDLFYLNPCGNTAPFVGTELDRGTVSFTIAGTTAINTEVLKVGRITARTS